MNEWLLECSSRFKRPNYPTPGEWELAFEYDSRGDTFENGLQHLFASSWNTKNFSFRLRNINTNEMVYRDAFE